MSGVLFVTGNISPTIVLNSTMASKRLTPETNRESVTCQDSDLVIECFEQSSADFLGFKRGFKKLNLVKCLYFHPYILLSPPLAILKPGNESCR